MRGASHQAIRPVFVGLAFGYEFFVVGKLLPQVLQLPGHGYHLHEAADVHPLPGLLQFGYLEPIGQFVVHFFFPFRKNFFVRVRERIIINVS